MADASFLYVTIDALDAAKAASFWAAVLGTEIDDELDEGRFTFLKGRVIELGGSWDGEERQLEPFTWRTLSDPEGTEFDIALVEE
jgi:hypothetical protein